MYNGVLAIWKARGMTSHDVVFRLRKILKMKKIGHTGTLDPEVDGVLVVCLGKATRIVRLLMDSTKTYTGEITLGYSTETEDAQGDIVDRKYLVEAISPSEIDAAMASFVGEIKQIPPMYSAVKVNGRRLYDYARAGEVVDRPTRSAQIFSFQRISEPVYDATEGTQSWRFDVVCGKGTYIRTLAVDLGAQLTYPAHMSDLTRLATSGLSESEALSLEEIEKAENNQTLMKFIHPVEKVLSDLPSIELDEESYKKVIHGQVLPNDYFGDIFTEEIALYKAEKLIAIYYPHPTKDGIIKPFIMFI